MYCSNCGNEVEGKFCSNCGMKMEETPATESTSELDSDTVAATEMQIMYCSNCGSRLEGKFCANCGAKAEVPSAAEDPSDHEQNAYDKKDNKNSAANKPRKKKDFATLYWDTRFKFLFICILIAGIAMCVMGYIICGIIMLILGVLLSPPIAKKYNKRLFWVFMALAILDAALAATLMESDEQNHGSSDTQITQSAGFDEKWYNTYRYFTTGESGTRNTMELYLSNDVYLEVALGGITEFGLSPDEYTEVSNGGYQYISDDQNYQLTYYPEDNNRIELVFAKGVLNYYPASPEEIKELEGILTGNSLEIDVNSVTTETNSFGYSYVIVNCSITNISNSPQDINFAVELDNNGVLTMGYTHDYLGKTLSSGATANASLEFEVQESDLQNVKNMKLVLDGEELSLQYF